MDLSIHQLLQDVAYALLIVVLTEHLWDRYTTREQARRWAASTARWGRDGLWVFTDSTTSVQYVGSPLGGLTPRLGLAGDVMKGNGAGDAGGAS